MSLKTTFFRKSINGTLRQVFYDAGRLRDSYANLVPSALCRYFTYAALGAAVTASVYNDPAQALGWAGLGILLYSKTIKDNSNIRILLSGGAGLLSVQNYLQGAFSGATQAGIAAVRPLVNAFIPDKYFKWRYATGALGLAAGGVIMRATDNGDNGALHYLPLMGMMCGTIADAMPDAKTNYARALRIAGSVPMIGYHGIISHSAPSILTELIGIGLNAHSAWKYDIKSNKVEHVKRPTLEKE